MAIWASTDDELEVDVVMPEGISHSSVLRLFSQVVRLALLPGEGEPVERLGIRWPTTGRSAPDFNVLPAGAIDLHTRSYVVGTTSPQPLVSVEFVDTSPPSPVLLARRGVTTYVVDVDLVDVVRFDATDGSLLPVPDGEPCADLGGIAFQRCGDRIGIVDPDGRLWTDPEVHLRTLAAERATATAERDAATAERDAATAELTTLRRRLAELEGTAQP